MRDVNNEMTLGGELKTIMQEARYKTALDRFLRFCDVKTYPAKTTIIAPGDPVDRLYFIVNGSVSVSTQTDDGERKLILAYLNKNNFIGEVGVFNGSQICKVSVISRSECYLAEISYERFHQLLAKELFAYTAPLLFILGVQVSARLVVTRRNLCDLVFMDVEGRIARTLLDLCKEPDAIKHPDGTQLSISRLEMSCIVGCTREMAGRAMKELVNQNLIVAKGKTIVVLGVYQ